MKIKKWINQVYDSKIGYVSIIEDGSTGWNTIYALKRALQIELGITQRQAILVLLLHLNSILDFQMVYTTNY